MKGEALVDAGDRWLLSLQGAVVQECCFAYAVVLKLFDGSSTWELSIEQSFVLATPDGMEHLVVPQEAAHLEWVVGVLRSAVDHAVATKDGHFELRFHEGVAVHVPPHEGFEAWTLTGPFGLRLVCQPGGEVAVWSAELPGNA